MKYYSVFKEGYSGTCYNNINLEDIMSSEISYKKRTKYRIILLI